MRKYITNNSRGFTLVETLVALFILGIALSSTVGIISLNLATAQAIKNSVIASGLTQEGVEVVRNLRDSDWFAGNSFGAFGSNDGLPISDGSYIVSWNSTKLNASSGTPLLKNENGIYGYSVGEETIFTRSVTITRISSVEIRAVVEVTWEDRGNAKRVFAEEHLFDWL